MFWRARFVGLISFVAACSGNDAADSPAYGYGRDEMRAAIEGTWVGTSRAPNGGATSPVTLSLLYSTPDLATQCGNRVLSLAGSIGSRCIDSSSMNVTGTLNGSLDADSVVRDMALRGNFDVLSLKFDGHGVLIGQLDDRQLEANLADGVLDGEIRASGDTNAITFTLQRK